MKQGGQSFAHEEVTGPGEGMGGDLLGVHGTTGPPRAGLQARGGVRCGAKAQHKY